MSRAESDHSLCTAVESAPCLSVKIAGATVQQTSAPDAATLPLDPFQELAPAGRDENTGRYLVGHPGPVKHGVYSPRVIASLLAEHRAELAAERAGILADLGGPAAVSVIKARLIDRYLEVSVMADWLGGNILAEGALTAKGKTRAASALYLQVLDRVHRLAIAIGLDRRARQVSSFADHVATRGPGDAR